MENITNLITTVGFPIAVAVYLLVRNESKLESLTLAITELTLVIRVMKEKE